jgi:drug/metabolite transporter (DMT)-like permease
MVVAGVGADGGSLRARRRAAGSGRRREPAGSPEAVQLAALAATGLVAFNLLVLAALEEAEPTAVGVVVGCVPIVLALAGPVLARRAPVARVVAALRSW